MRLAMAVFAVFAVFATGATAATNGGSAHLLWDGAFQNDASAWTGVQARDGGFTIVQAPGRRPGNAARFLVRPGDVPIGTGGERAEVYKETDEAAGTDSFWAWSVYFPRASASSPGTSWNVFTQWHQTVSGGVQPLSFEVANQNGREWLRLRSWGGNASSPVRRAWILAPLVRGKWFDFALHVRWASDSTGLLQVWLDKKQVLPATHTPTLYAGESVYLKQGFYRASSSVTSEVYVAGTKRGATLADIGINPTAKPPLRAKRVTAPSRPASGAATSGAPSKSARPTISGTVRVGSVIGLSTGKVRKGSAPSTYQWQWSRDGGTTWLDVRGATRRTFVVSPTFAGARLRVIVVSTTNAARVVVASVAVPPTT